MTTSISIVSAFLAGLASFVSPCVLPIVPGYLSFISGVNLAQYKGQETAPARVLGRVTITSLAFVLGFSTVFVGLGAAATLLGHYLREYKRELAFVGGAIVFILGLHTAGFVKIPFLLYEKRSEVRDRPLGLPGAYLVGLAFGFGWTPCIGPILGGILVYASQQETMAQGVVLLTSYSAGLGVPFILASLAINRFFKASGAIKRHMHAVEVVSGVLLMAVGVLLMTNRLELLARWFAKTFPVLNRIG